MSPHVSESFVAICLRHGPAKKSFVEKIVATNLPREDTDMGSAVGGMGSSKFPPVRLEGGSNSPFAARPRRSYSLLKDVKPAEEGQEAP